MLRPCCFLLIPLLLGGCASYPRGPSVAAAGPQEACLDFYRQTERTVLDYGGEDGGDHRLPGYPFLRSNRFLASFAGEPLSDAAYSQWLELLRQVDERARMPEFANLPAEAKTRINSLLPAGSNFREHLQSCGRLLVEATARSPHARRELAAAALVPDDYLSWRRVAGLYPLARWFAAYGVNDLHRELQQPFELAPEQIPVSGRLIRYLPKASDTAEREEIGAMLEEAYRNPLEIPLLEADRLERLYALFAPVWEIDTLNGNDAIGEVTISEAGKPKVDGKSPTVYVQSAYTRFHGENLLQLIYQVWFPAREKTGWLDLYGGELDSVIWRVTLDPRGRPIAYDSIHACGCYYLLFPAAGYRALAGSGENEPVLSPRRIESDPFAHRLVVRLAARTHYLQQVSPQREAAEGKPYVRRPYRKLRSLPGKDGSRSNPFGRDGIIDSSARAERFLLWPFGVASPGAMRQWGRHAIAFIGRRHFDDAALLEKLLAREKAQEGVSFDYTNDGNGE